nr:2140_t:CDS:2 [Entrophospora candida]
MSWKNDIRVIVGLDFGCTFSGFSYVHTSKQQEIITNETWPDMIGQLKINTVLQYDSNFETVKSWGLSALAKKPRRKGKKKEETRPVELFKLHLTEMPYVSKPSLPLDYKKVVTERWEGIDFTKNVLLIATVPAEYSEKANGIMRECIYKAGLISTLESQNLQFTTEPEAAAVFCLKSVLNQHSLETPGTVFMIVDCGGGTVDLTTYKLWRKDQLGETVERAGDFCGSSFVDNKFIEYLGEEVVGKDAINSLKKDHYGQFQFLIQAFCKTIKNTFTGRDVDHKYEMDLEEVCPDLIKYLRGSKKEELEESEYVIELDYTTVKSFFDPIIERIIEMIRVQLDSSKCDCSAIFLVGGFSQSMYLQVRIRGEFSCRVPNISVPSNPIAAVCRGASIYGLSLFNNNYLGLFDGDKFVINNRVLKYTYGIGICARWREGDPPERRSRDNYIRKFERLAKRGQIVKIDKEFSDSYAPIKPEQTSINFIIYYTKENDAKYPDDPGLKVLGNLRISLPDTKFGVDRPVLFSLCFSKMEITCRAINKRNGQNCETKFKLEF